MTEQQKEDLAKRFWAKVAIRGPNECWEWQAASGGSAHYGVFWYRGRNIMAHRMAWMLRNQSDIPAGMFVCHHCDNPPCCNPDHLFLGTPLDNHMDMRRKGRMVVARLDRSKYLRAEDSPQSKLTWELVKQIRFLYANREKTTYQLAAEFSISRPAIYGVIHNRTWYDPNYQPAQTDFRTRSGPGNSVINWGHSG